MRIKSHCLTLLFIIFFQALSINILLSYDAVHKKKYLDVTADFRNMYFFNKELYLVSFNKPLAQSGSLLNYKYTLGSDGNISDDGKTLIDAEINNSAGMGVASAVYKGVIYLFYDKLTPGVHGKYDIYYKTSSNPESGWLPGDGSGFDTDATASTYDNSACFKAVVFNDLLYLFYWNKDEGIFYKYFNGRKWSDDICLKIGNNSNKVKPFFIAETILKNNKAFICIGAISLEAPTKMQLLYLNKKNKVIEGPLINDFTARAQSYNYISAAVGSLGGEKQESGNMLQIFAHNCAVLDSNIVRREVNLETGKVYPWRDTDMVVDLIDSKYVSPIPVIIGAVSINKKSFRQYIITLYKKALYKGRFVFSYESDFLLLKRQSDSVTTEDEKGCWNLLGVVEGCPPYTRNGKEGDNKTSSIIYGYSETQEVDLSTTYGLSVSVKATLGNDSLKIGGEAKQAFEVSNASSTTKTDSLTIPLGNSFENKNGTDGWFLFAQPTLKSRTYQKFSQMDTAHKKIICEYTAISVASVGYVFDNYKLDSPPVGMLKRKASTDLTSWGKNKTLRSTNFIDTSSINPLTVSLSGQDSCTSKLSFEESKKISSSLETTLTISGEAAKEDLFKLETENDIKISFESSTTYTWGKSVEANLTLSPPESGKIGILSMQVKPLWYITKDNVSISDFTSKPYWIPNSYANSNQAVPWCVSWIVTSVKKGKYINNKL